MKINLHRLAGTGFGAALAIMLSVDVDAAPLSIAQAPTQISAFDGLVTQAWFSILSDSALDFPGAAATFKKLG